MPSLVAGYGSSDDESPSLNASTSLPTLGGSFNSNEAAVDDYEDDEKIEEEAEKDAFGLTSMVKSERETESKRQKEVVTSAPDVLKEVSKELDIIWLFIQLS